MIPIARAFVPFILAGLTAVPARAALDPDSPQEIRTGGLQNGFPDFCGTDFQSGTVAGTLRAANFFGSTVNLRLPGGTTQSVTATGLAGNAWLTFSTGAQAPATANSGAAMAFTTTSDASGRNNLANTGFHGMNGWYCELTGLTAGDRWRIQLLNTEGFAAGNGRNFDLTVDGTLAFNDFNPPAAGAAPYSAIAQFEATVDAGGKIRVLTGAGSPAVSGDTNPYLNGLAMVKVDTTPAPPSFALQPIGFSRLEEDSGSLTVSVAGFPFPTLQWFKGADPVSGGTGPTLDFPSLALADAGSYTVKATSTSGTVTSNVAAIEVGPQPSGLLRQLRGWWKFDETSGAVAADASPYGHAGILTNFPADGTPWVAGRAGGALQFRGATSADYVRVAEYLVPRGPLTVSAWAWAEARPTSASIVKTWHNPLFFSLGLDSASGRLSNYLNPGTSQVFVRDLMAFPLGSWQHTAFTADGSTLRVFRNGESVGSVKYTQNVGLPLLSQLGIGAKLNSTGSAADAAAPGYWLGKLDDVAVWARALGAGEINTIYTGGLNGQNISQVDASPAGGVVITEFLSSNTGGLKDEDLSSPDWIEIYNGADVPVNLEGWHLTDDPAIPGKWRFPASVLGAKQFLIVFASEKDRAVAGQPLHTNFKLTTTGEYLALLKPDGTISSAYAPLFPPQMANISFGLARPPTDAETPGSEAYGALLRYYQIPTPGGLNASGTSALGPLVQGLAHFPALPADGADLTVTATVVPSFAPVASVELRYRINFGTEMPLPMTSGADGRWSAALPASASTPGQLVRYFITATDTSGRTSRWPSYLDPATQPQYLGTVVADPAITSGLPVFHWWVQSTGAAETVAGTRCSLFHNGVLYDNIFCRIRGGTSISWPKKSYKLEFNDGYEFQRQPGHTVDEFDLNTTYTDKSYNRAVLHYELNRDAGLPSPDTFQVQLRRNGTFYSVTLYTEQPDADFLRRTGLDPDGALYKGGPGANGDSIAGYEKKTRQEESFFDLQSLITGVAQTGSSLERFVFDQIDVPAEVNFMACMAVTQNIDGTDKNHFLYRDTGGSREWRTLPWDLDLSFGPNALNTDAIVYNQQDAISPQATSHPFIGARPWLLHSGKYHRLLEAIVNTPRTRAMLLRRVRTLTDQFLGTNYFQSRLDTLVPLLAPDVAADKARWGANAHFPGTTYTLEAANNRIRNEYLAAARRPAYLRGTTINGVLTANPAAQLPTAAIEFGPVVYDPGTGSQDGEYFILTNPGSTAVDVSGWTVSGDIRHTLKPGTVIPAGDKLHLTPDTVAFRARPASPRGWESLFVQGNYSGQLSARGGTLTLINPARSVVAATTWTGTPSAAQNALRITEIMYNASGSDAAEFIELKNTGAVPIPLGAVRFTSGVAFEWTDPAASVDPGAYLVLVRDPVGFAAAYPGVRIHGHWTGSLDNDGERLHLVDAIGENILDFDYEDDWYPSTDGRGCSLTVVDELAMPAAWDRKTQWGPSHVYRGSPGASQPAFPQDSDDDGQDDYFEANFGSDPLSASSRFEVRATAAPAIHFPAAAGILYQLEQSADLQSWVTHSSIGPFSSARPVTQPVTPPAGPPFYYRIRADLP